MSKDNEGSKANKLFENSSLLSSPVPSSPSLPKRQLKRHRRPFTSKTNVPRHIKRRVQSFLYKLEAQNKMPKHITVALSGGKDSTTVAYFLAQLKDRFGYELSALFIQLGIPTFSSKSREVVEAIASKLDIPLHVVKPEKPLHKIVEEKAEEIRAGRFKICAACGVIKRYLMNKFCWEHFGKDGAIATGHNMDDELSFLFRNIFSQSGVTLPTKGPIAPGNEEEKLCTRLKPLFWVREAKIETFKDVLKKEGLPIVETECPFKEGNSQARIKAFIDDVEKLSRRHKLSNFPSSLLKYMVGLSPHISLDRSWRKQCKICGYPTSAEDSVCTYCKLMGRGKNGREAQNKVRQSKVG